MDKNAKYDAYIIGVFVVSPFILFFLLLSIMLIESEYRRSNRVPQASQFKTIELDNRDYVISAYFEFDVEPPVNNIRLSAKNKVGEERFLASYNDVQQDSIAFFKIKKDTVNIVLYGKPDTFHLFLPRKFEDIKITEGLDK
jgi:hypothetical protein